jgi:hypothetical protein
MGLGFLKFSYYYQNFSPMGFLKKHTIHLLAEKLPAPQNKN